MPGFIGKKLCPDLLIVPTNFKAYQVASKEVREILGQYDPNFCPMSLDEAYLDMTEHIHLREGLGKKERTYPKRVDPQRLCRCENLQKSPSTCKSPSKNPPTGCVSDPTDTGVERKTLTLNSGKTVDNTMSQINVTTCPSCGKATSAEHLQELETFGTTVEEAVREMRFRIQQKTELTASAGILNCNLEV